MYRDSRRRNLIRLIAETSGGNQAQFADLIGKSPSYVGQLVRGVGSFGERVARQIEKQCGKPRGWLDGAAAQAREPSPRASGLCPVLSWVAAGSFHDIEMSIDDADQADEWMPCPVKHGPQTFVLQVRGESMYNPIGRLSFADGDLIFVDPARRAENRSCVVVRRADDNTATFKQLIVEGDRPAEQRYLKPLNPVWPEPILALRPDDRLCGVVIFKGMPL